MNKSTVNSFYCESTKESKLLDLDLWFLGFLLVLWSTRKNSSILDSSIPKNSVASCCSWQNWISSFIGNWLGIAPSSGSWGPWIMIFFADGTLAVMRIEASTYSNYHLINSWFLINQKKWRKSNSYQQIFARNVMFVSFKVLVLRAHKVDQLG